MKPDRERSFEIIKKAIDEFINFGNIKTEAPPPTKRELFITVEVKSFRGPESITRGDISTLEVVSGIATRILLMQQQRYGNLRIIDISLCCFDGCSTILNYLFNRFREMGFGIPIQVEETKGKIGKKERLNVLLKLPYGIYRLDLNYSTLPLYMTTNGREYLALLVKAMRVEMLSEEEIEFFKTLLDLKREVEKLAKALIHETLGEKSMETIIKLEEDLQRYWGNVIELWGAETKEEAITLFREWFKKLKEMQVTLKRVLLMDAFLR